METRTKKRIRTDRPSIPYSRRNTKEVYFRYTPSRLIRWNDLVRALHQQIHAGPSLNKLYASLLLKELVGDDPDLIQRSEKIKKEIRRWSDLDRLREPPYGSPQ